MSELDKKVVAYSIVQYLEGLKSDASLDSGKLDSAVKTLQEVLGVDLQSVEDFKHYSVFPTALNEVVAAGCKALEVDPYEVALVKVQANGKYEGFLETVEKKGYFNGAEAGSLDYLQRHAKMVMKFKEKVGVKGANAEAAAEQKKQEGNTAIANKDYHGAVRSYTEALELSSQGPNSHIYFTNRAAAYCYLKDYANAVTDCEKAVLLDPLYVKAYTRLGLANFFMENYEKAVDAYQRAVDLEPDNKTHKDSLRQAKAKLDEKTTVAPSSSSSSGAAGGLPDLSSLLSGGEGGMPDMGSLMRNPAIMQAAQEMMKNPQMMQQALSMLGGNGGGAGGMPDMAALSAMMQGMQGKKGGKR